MTGQSLRKTFLRGCEREGGSKEGTTPGAESELSRSVHSVPSSVPQKSYVCFSDKYLGRMTVTCYKLRQFPQWPSYISASSFSIQTLLDKKIQKRRPASYPIQCMCARTLPGVAVYHLLAFSHRDCKVPVFEILASGVGCLTGTNSSLDTSLILRLDRSLADGQQNSSLNGAGQSVPEDFLSHSIKRTPIYPRLSIVTRLVCRSTTSNGTQSGFPIDFTRTFINPSHICTLINILYGFNKK